MGYEYQPPVIEIVKFNTADVMTVSPSTTVEQTTDWTQYY